MMAIEESYAQQIELSRTAVKHCQQTAIAEHILRLSCSVDRAKLSHAVVNLLAEYLPYLQFNRLSQIRIGADELRRVFLDYAMSDRLDSSIFMYQQRFPFVPLSCSEFMAGVEYISLSRRYQKSHSASVTSLCAAILQYVKCMATLHIERIEPIRILADSIRMGTLGSRFWPEVPSSLGADWTRYKLREDKEFVSASMHYWSVVVDCFAEIVPSQYFGTFDIDRLIKEWFEADCTPVFI